MVELLIAITVVVVLTSLVVVASMAFVKGARENATRTTIKKIDEMLSRRMTAFQTATETRHLAGGAVDGRLYGQLDEYRDIPNGPLKSKLLTAKFFGMAFGEPVSHSNVPASKVWWASDLAQLDASGNAVGGSELAALVAEGKFVAARHNRATESAEMLYWFLVNGPTFGADVIEADAFNTSEVADTDGDGLLEFVDAWGQPLRFYRWPTRILRPGPPSAPATAPSSGAYFPLGASYPGGTTTPTTPTTLPVDHPATFLIASLPTLNTIPATGQADDPTSPGLRPNVPLAWDHDDESGDVLTAFAGSAGLTLAVVRKFELDVHTPNTWHAPLIVSGGADQSLGLFEPYDRANYGHLAQPQEGSSASGFSEALQDNITNLNSRASGTGGQ